MKCVCVCVWLQTVNRSVLDVCGVFGFTGTLMRVCRFLFRSVSLTGSSRPLSQTQTQDSDFLFLLPYMLLLFSRSHDIITLSALLLINVSIITDHFVPSVLGWRDLV